MDLRDLVDATFRLMILWYSLSAAESAQAEAIHRYFRDRETEYETGELTLPGWAAIGNAAAIYGEGDGADPFATPEEPFPPPPEPEPEG